MRRVAPFSILLILALVIPAITASAQITAVVSEVRGRVEILKQGGNWQPATQGAVVNDGTTISTGFNSTAVLKMGLSTVTVQQLTRMRLDQLVEQQGRISTSFTLPIGRVQASVKSASGAPQDFQIRSPISTAAVRGTQFSFNGYVLIVNEGTVAFFNRLGQLLYVQHGQNSETNGESPPNDPSDQFDNDTGTQLPGTPGGSLGGGGQGGQAGYGSITVTF
jgi:hypothetical protein